LRASPAPDRVARGICGVALLLATFMVVPVRAQDAPRAGEIVEARIVGPSDPMLGRFCIAPAGGIVGDTVLLGRSANCSSGSHLARVRVSRGDAGSRLEHAGIGFLIGAVAGGVVGRLTARGCVTQGCGEDAGLVAAIHTVLGSAVGGVAGAVVGASRPAGPQWIQLEPDRPIRVGSLDLRPTVRVSLGAGRR